MRLHRPHSRTPILALPLMLLFAALNGCSLIGGPPSDARHYDCRLGSQFAVALDENEAELWIQDIGQDLQAQGNGIYADEYYRLELQGDTAHLNFRGDRLFQDCKVITAPGK